MTLAKAELKLDPRTSIPKFLLRKGREKEFAAAASAAASRMATVSVAETSPLSPEDQEIATDARKMLIPASVMNDPVSKQLYLASKHGKELARAERLQRLTESKPPRVPKRASREGLVTVATVAKELGVIPRIARHALRSLKISKPVAGWAFTAEQAAEMKKKITAFLAQPKAPKKARKASDTHQKKEATQCKPTPSDTSTGKKRQSKRAPSKKRVTKR